MAKRINILISEENLAIIDKYAAAAKMSRSAYISKTCIDKPPIIISGAEEIVQLLGKCYADKRISRSNSSKRDIDQILDAFTRIIDKLNELNNGSSEHYTILNLTIQKKLPRVIHILRTVRRNLLNPSQKII